jgi:predicted transcriptional regulator
MKTDVYSWRLSGELKSDLERVARARKAPVSTVLETAVRDWLRNHDSTGDEQLQRELHASAAATLGVLAAGDPHRAETARQTLRRKLKAQHAG